MLEKKNTFVVIQFVMMLVFLNSNFQKKYFKDYPPQKGYIRGTIHLTAYFVRAINNNSCEITYVTHSDPKGCFLTVFYQNLTLKNYRKIT